MKTVTKKTAAGKVKRVVRLVKGMLKNDPDCLVIFEVKGLKTNTTHFWLEKFPTDFGRGYFFKKWLTDIRDDGIDPGCYEVLLHGDESTCSCIGHERWGHCRHTSALQALDAAGQLEPVAASVF